MAVSSIASAINNALSAQQQTVASQTSTSSAQVAIVATFSSSASSSTSSSSTSFSSIGQTKLSLDSLQARASALGSFQESPNFTDLQVVVLGFVQAFNTVHTNLVKSSEESDTSTTTRQDSTTSDTTTTSSNTNTQSLNELLSAVSAATTTDTTTLSALQEIGITQAENGTLQVDQAKFEKAVKELPEKSRDVLAELGKRVEQAAEKLLGNKSEKTTSSVEKPVETTSSVAPAVSSAATSALSAYTKVSAL